MGKAVYLEAELADPADISNAGGLSAYGTMAQNGNVWEWGESGFTATNDSAGDSRVIRGGSWDYGPGWLSASIRLLNGSPSDEITNVGFRFAAVPEPSGALLTLIGMIGVVLRRKRG